MSTSEDKRQQQQRDHEECWEFEISGLDAIKAGSRTTRSQRTVDAFMAGAKTKRTT